jgi:hypothetical protein
LTSKEPFMRAKSSGSAIGRALDRRTLLRGVVQGTVVGLALPPLEAMLNAHGTAFANGTPFPKRFGTWFFGNGVRPARFFPRTTGRDWELTPGTMPLAPVKPYINIISGTNCPAPGGAHHSGQAGMLSGQEPTMLANDGSTFKRPSIDYTISRQWRGQTRFDLVNLAVHQEHRYQRGTPGHISHNGASFNPNETSVGRLYDRFFGGGLPRPATGGAGVDAAKARAAARAKVLDAVLADEKDLRKRVSVEDRQRLDKHLEGLVALQRRLRDLEASGMDGGPMACGKAARPTGDYPQRNDALAPRNQAFAEVLAMALACDLTRVFSYQHHTWYSPVFREAGNSGQQHALTHDEPGDQPQVHASTVFVMKQFATFVSALQAVKEGAGSLLDNSLVLAVTEVCEGRTHSKNNMPVLTAGAAGRTLKTGLHVRAAGVSSYRIHVTCFRALGLPFESFGSTNERGTLSELLV